VKSPKRPLRRDGYASCEGCLTITSAIPSTLKFFLAVVVASPAIRAHTHPTTLHPTIPWHQHRPGCSPEPYKLQEHQHGYCYGLCARQDDYVLPVSACFWVSAAKKNAKNKNKNGCIFGRAPLHTHPQGTPTRCRFGWGPPRPYWWAWSTAMQ
jgi:hypothetical protein